MIPAEVKRRRLDVDADQVQRGHSAAVFVCAVYFETFGLEVQKRA